MLVDPQTSGGLLASVPENLAPDCLRKLSGGYAASIVGHVVDSAERAVEPNSLTFEESCYGWPKSVHIYEKSHVPAGCQATLVLCLVYKI